MESNPKARFIGCFEVTIGWYGKERVDYITYDTKGIWRCYEIKVSKSDFHSKAKKTFIGHYNYFVVTRELYNEIKNEIHCNIVSFMGVEFSYDKIYIPYKNYIDTIRDKWDGDTRYVYYGSKTKFKGTIFSNLRDDTVNDTKFYNDKNIEETVEYLESDVGVIIFWIFWLILISGCIFGFYYLDNKWLE